VVRGVKSLDKNGHCVPEWPGDREHALMMNATEEEI